MDLRIVKKSLPTILMNCDNQTTIVNVDNSKENRKSSRHIKRWLKSVKKMRNFGVIILDYIHIEKNLADLFTKGLSRNMIDAAS
jgi:fructose-1,6-bisphosphatase/inositol monophosphatase family enzyme